MFQQKNEPGVIRTEEIIKLRVWIDLAIKNMWQLVIKSCLIEVKIANKCSTKFNGFKCSIFVISILVFIFLMIF